MLNKVKGRFYIGLNNPINDFGPRIKAPLPVVFWSKFKGKTKLFCTSTVNAAKSRKNTLSAGPKIQVSEQAGDAAGMHAVQSAGPVSAVRIRQAGQFALYLLSVPDLI